MPKVSVHLVTYNNAKTVQCCLDSLLAQQDADFEVVVIDNASSDNTVSIVENMGLSVVVNNKNLGYSKAHNQAIDQTDSAYVLTLNPDIWLDPRYIYHLTCALDETPEIGSASGCLLRVDQLGTPPLGIDSTGVFIRRNRRQGLRYENQPVTIRPMERQFIFGPDGAAAFYRRAMLDDIRIMGEVFDVDFFIQKEDVDVCWRAQLRGWQSLYVPDALAHHIRSFRPGQRYRHAVSKEMRFYAVRNRYLLMIKNEIPLLFWRDFLNIAVYDLGIVAYILLRERDAWAAIVAAVALTRQMHKKRRIIQSSRQVSWRSMRQWFW